jgi:hypothetical protein
MSNAAGIESTIRTAKNMAFLPTPSVPLQGGEYLHFKKCFWASSPLGRGEGWVESLTTNKNYFSQAEFD